MSAAEFRDDVEAEESAGNTLALAPDAVEVRRNAGLAAFVGAVASAVAIAYLARATGTGAALDWVLASVMAVLGITYLAGFVDARTPLVVADAQGVRVRLGRSWRGIPWGALTRVEHTPRRGFLRDGRLVMVVRSPARLIEELDRGGRRQSRVQQLLYGAPFAVPLAISTRVTGAGADLTEALTRLAAGSAPVVEIADSAPAPADPAQTDSAPADPPESVVEERALRGSQARTSGTTPATVSKSVSKPGRVDEPEATDEPVEAPDPEDRPLRTRRWLHPGPAVAHAINAIGGRLQRTPVEEPAEEPAVEPEASEPETSPTPSPLRDPVAAQRAEVRKELEELDAEGVSAGRELRRPGSVNLVEDTQVWGERVTPIARAGDAVEPLLIDDFAAEPADDPVVGPEFAAARTRLGLTVDQLAERTRIRPHVIESIEVDDFAPCGGDFYARGHLRTLARVLGIDVAPLLSAYNELYADAPINPRRVFEAELATGAHGSIRGTRGGPNWSVLIAAVMALVLAWSVARLIMDSPVALPGAQPVLNGSAGVDNGSQQAAPPVPVVLTAAGGGARVVVRDGTGELIFTGNLAFGETKTFKVSPPVRVQTSDGSLVATVDGEERGALGATGEQAQTTFPVS